MTATNVERSFDLDGTLTDAREGIVACLKYALQGLGHNCPSNLDPARFIGPPLQESFAVLLHSTDPKQINAAVELYRQQVEMRRRFDAAAATICGINLRRFLKNKQNQ